MTSKRMHIGTSLLFGLLCGLLWACDDAPSYTVHKSRVKTRAGKKMHGRKIAITGTIVRLHSASSVLVVGADEHPDRSLTLRDGSETIRVSYQSKKIGPLNVTDRVRVAGRVVVGSTSLTGGRGDPRSVALVATSIKKR